MFRTLTAAAVLATLAAFSASSAFAQTASAPAKAKAAKKAPAKKAAAVAEPVSATNDNLGPGQLSMADRVLTGVANCEFKEKVDIEKIEGHSGNFKLTFDRKTYIMVPEETTTGAIRLVDTGGAVVWVQIPIKSMLMNQREHHRMVDDCQEDEQRIAVNATNHAAANAPSLAPSVAGPLTVSSDPAIKTTSTSAVTAVKPATATAPAALTTTTTTTTQSTTTLVPPPPIQRGAVPADAAASGMWK
jgi:hypothetical protein